MASLELEPAVLDAGPDAVRMHLARQIRAVQKHYESIYCVFTTPELTLAPFRAACTLADNHAATVRFDIPGPNIAVLSVAPNAGRLHLHVQLQCRLQNLPPAGGDERERAAKRKRGIEAA